MKTPRIEIRPLSNTPGAHQFGIPVISNGLALRENRQVLLSCMKDVGFDLNKPKETLRTLKENMQQIIYCMSNNHADLAYGKKTVAYFTDSLSANGLLKGDSLSLQNLA